MRTIFTERIILEQLKDLGVEKGDTILVRASLGSIGRLETKNRRFIVDCLLKAIGKEGTLVSLSFSPSYILGISKEKTVFSRYSKSNSGALPNIMLSFEDAYRSEHPTNSFVAIGQMAPYVVENHGPNDLSYSPMKKLLELDAKMLVIGCTNDSPGFTTVHLAQQELGLTKKNLLKGLLHAFYNYEGTLKRFVRNDIGGCSKGFGKFYEHYSNLHLGTIGKASSMLVSCREAYAIEKSILNREPKYALCDDSGCIICRCTWSFNLKDVPRFIGHKIKASLNNK